VADDTQSAAARYHSCRTRDTFWLMPFAAPWIAITTALSCAGPTKTTNPFTIAVHELAAYNIKP
jgi:hypothetical protein